ncbi:MAG: serine/threonine-protein kinase [Gemmatimonadales bacterium]|nr:serine/threonine-protein kinase [Gemmatimonadales bacterium]
MADPSTVLSEALAAQYRLEHTLGRGGMATVYRAHDLKHDRPVALKVLHPELAAILGPERFQREIRLAARLQHPHILGVFDSGVAGGRFWFTMPCVDGESLRARMERHPPMPARDALRLVREAADALTYAHEHGVLHRDIKPENLLLTADGHVLVADFGVARPMGEGGDGRLTETGFTLGTPAYMSPEQATGEGTLDARSDQYALACVLYELLTGAPPHAGPTAQAILVRRFTEPLVPLRERRPDLPPSLDVTLARALAPLRDDRFASTRDFVAALEADEAALLLQRLSDPALPVARTPTPAAGIRPPAIAAPAAAPAPARPWGWLVAAAVTVLAVGGFLWSRREGAAPDGDGVRRLAVLPFENLGAATDEYFSDGITDEVRGKLAALPGLQVTARASSAEYKATRKPFRDIGRELGVQYLLTGTVRWEKRGDASRVRVSPELVNAETGAATWQQPFDAALTDVFQVQADIAARVASALDLALGASQRQRLDARPTGNLKAYDAFLQGEEVGQSLSRLDPPSLQAAAGLYEKAVALDSLYAPAWAQLGRAQALLYGYSTPTPDGAARARRAAERAAQLAPERAEGYLALADYHQLVRGAFADALEACRRGLVVVPGSAELLAACARAEQSLGRWEATLDYLVRGARLDPRSAATARRLALTTLLLRRYPDAIAAADRALALDPQSLQVLQTKTMAYVAQGDLPGARAVIAAAPASVDPTALVAHFASYWDLFWVLDDAQQQLLLRLTPAAFGDDRGTWGVVLAQVHALRGDQPRARAYADSARAALDGQLAGAPDDAQLLLLKGLALAYAGRGAEAVKAGERGTALLPMEKDAYVGAYLQHQLVRILLLAGEPDRALDHLAPLLARPYLLSPGWLGIDPAFSTLRGTPRFERLRRGATDVARR